MTSSPAVIFEEDLVIPAGVSDLDRFRRWTWGESFPERGRIDFLDGTVEVDLSPEDLYTHGTVKTTLSARLYPLIVDSGRGSLFSDRTRVVSPAAGLSVEPDVVAVLWESLQQGRIREVPAAKAEDGRFIELEGAQHQTRSRQDWLSVHAVHSTESAVFSVSSAELYFE